MTRRLAIAVVGYGIAGISAAILLRRRGHEVVHFERAALPGFGGGGLLLNATGLEVLHQLGLHGAAMSRGALVSRVSGETRNGSKVMDLRYEDCFPGNFGLGIQRSAIFELLRAADEHTSLVKTSRRIASVDTVQGYLFDEDQGRLGPFDLIVAADGANSSIRNNLSSLVRRDRPYRWGAVMCLLDDPNGLGRDRVLQNFAGTRHVAIWPVGSHVPGAARRINVSINVPVDHVERFRDVSLWKHHVVEISPQIAPLLSEVNGESDLLSFTYRDVVLRRYYKHCVVFIGDAAHCMSPQLGQGASMALLDSWVLSQALEHNEDISLALTEFDRERRAQVSAYQFISRWITPMFQSESRTLALLRDKALYRLTQVPFVKDSMLKTLSGRRKRLFRTPKEIQMGRNYRCAP